MAFSAQRALMGAGELAPMTLLNVWTTADNIFATDHQARGLIFGEGLFVAVGGIAGNNSFIETSPDGITWTSRTTPHGVGFQYIDITYGDGLFVVTGSFKSPDLIVVTSTDGITWTDRTAAASIGLVEGYPSFANGTYFIAGRRLIFSSSDGITWTQRHQHSATNARLRTIAFGGGKYVCVGWRISACSAQTLDSSDFITWTEREIPASVNYRPDGIIWDGIQFLASGADVNSSSQCRIESSPAGVTWTEETTITTALRFFSDNAMDFRRSLYNMYGNTGFNLDAVVGYADTPDIWITYSITSSRPGIGMAFSPTRAVILGSTSGAGEYRTWRGYQNI